MKYVKLFEDFLLNERVKVELGNLDPKNMKDEPKIKQVNDILKQAEGKSCTMDELISIIGHLDGTFDSSGAEGTSTKQTSTKILKNTKVTIRKVDYGTFYSGFETQVFYKYDTAVRDGYKYHTNGQPDLTGEVDDYMNRAKDKNGKFNGIGVKFKDFPSIYPDYDTNHEKNGDYGYGQFQIYYPKPNEKNGAITMQRFADVFGLGDIIPNFPDAKGNVTDYDNVDYYGKLSVNAYQFIKGSMSKMVSFLEEGDIDTHGNNHTNGAGTVLCNKKDLKKIHEDLLDGFEGKTPRLNNIPMIGIDAKAEENGSVIDSPVYQKKWDQVAGYLGARDTSDLVCVNILMRLGGPSTNYANNSFSKEEIDYAQRAYNGFSGWSRTNVPEGLAPLVKRIRVKKYTGDKLA
jgi:hypothetical protein